MNDLQKQTKKCVLLHAKGIHHVVHKYLFARDSAFKAQKSGSRKNSYPYRQKKYFTTGWDYQSIKIDCENNIIYLARPMKNNIKQKPIKCYSKNIPQNIKEIELIWRGKLCLVIKYIDQTDYQQIKSDNVAAIDLGEIHSITAINNSGNAIIITGRKMRSIKRLRNKNQGKIYSKMSNCKKGSKQYKKYSKTLQKIKQKADNQIRDCVHKITKLFLDYCLINNISIVYYGDLDSATRGTKQKRKGNKIVRQKLSQWNIGEIMSQLENKLKRYGVKLIKIKEYYTSQKCPSCNHLNKPKNREYKCTNCNYKQHRDIVGAINILNDNRGLHIKRYSDFKYLQIA